MRMAAERGPESRGARAGGSGPFDAGTLAGRAWLAALPDELAAQRLSWPAWSTGARPGHW